MSWRAWSTFATLCAIWGIPYFLIKLALEDFWPAMVAWGRVTLGALVLMPIAWKRGALGPRSSTSPPCQPSQWRSWSFPSC